jgi:YhcG PDDEXK nuclease domain
VGLGKGTIQRVLLTESSIDALSLVMLVLIDLKINEVQHQDIGQMNLYMGYFANEENTESDNPPIGVILTKNKDELLVEYATYQMNS